jgi:hypothetical protein
MFPQLAQFTDLSLLLLRLMVAKWQIQTGPLPMGLSQIPAPILP